MADAEPQFIEVARLRVGHYVFIDLSWLSHPFPLNSFRIASAEQIETIKSLGIERIRYCPARSDPEAVKSCAAEAVSVNAASDSPSTREPASEPVAMVEEGDDDNRRARREMLASQRASLIACERQFGEAARVYRQVVDLSRVHPDEAREHSENMVHGVLNALLAQEETCIRLLSEKMGERSSMHAVNVSVVSLLLGRACGLSPELLFDLGLGAMLHDIGKIELPDRLRWPSAQLSGAEQQLYQEHVAHGLALGKKMGLTKEVLLVIAQHHERADGKGYPLHLAGERISQAARIVALVNYYDGLCNPGNPAAALTPHEALSHIFAHAKAHFDPATLSTFIRMMGVYPPGSVVQLSDERFALVVSVNSTRPLRPLVIIHDQHVPKDEALIVALEERPELGIRRSLRPLQLPAATIDYLSPRQRICYYFERARDPAGSGGGE